MRKIYLRLTYDIWRRSLPKFVAPKQELAILECGTGPGHFSSLLEEWFPHARLYGLDVDPQTIRNARQVTQRTRFLVASAECLPFSAQEFDVIFSFHMIEHLPDPESFFREAARVLRPGGILILATPNPESIGARIMKKRWASYCPDHISLHPPRHWLNLLNHHGFSPLRDGTTGLSGIPLLRKMPLGLLNWGPLFLFGFFPWHHGEAYICIARKEG